MPKIQLTPEALRKIEEALAKGKVAEVKIEHSEVVVIEINRKLIK